MMSYVFGGNTGLTAEDIAKRRAQAAAMQAQRDGRPQNAGQGLASAGASLGAGLLRRQANMAEQANAAGQSMDATSQPVDPQRAIARALMPKRPFGFGGGR